MKIAIRPLREGSPVAVHEKYDPKQLELEFVDLTYVDPVRVEGMVEKIRDTLTFRGQLKSRVEHTCARCLKQVEEKVERPFDLFYEVKGKDEVDTLDDLREVLILDHPIRFLCRDDCQGLCPHCGADLNLGLCACQKS